MTNQTFHKRLYEVTLNEGWRGGDLSALLDKYAPNMYRKTMYGSNEVTVQFLQQLPKFRKWAKANGITWITKVEQDDALWNCPYALDTPECNRYIDT